MRGRRVCLAVGIAAALCSGTARSQPADEFFRGKTVTLICGVSPGGTYDATARLLARHFGEHLPGKPTVVVQTMLGAGGTSAVLHLYNAAVRDGTVFATLPRNFPIAPYFNPQLKYDARRFNAIGSTSSEVAVAVAWHTVPVKRFEDSFTRELSVGATSYLDNTGSFALLAKNLTDAKIRLVTGYPGGNDVGAAMEKGEVDARFGWSWGSVKSRARNWITEKKITVLLQIGLEKAADLPDTPMMLDYAKTDRDRQAMELLLSPQAFAWPFVAPPDLPAARLAQLRRAFDETMQDKGFLAEAKKIDIEVDPMAGDRMQALIARVLSFDDAVIERARQLSKPPA